ncbi:MAG: RNA 2',3'-cyclic phosphodiesterase [Candidatus Micrarchaeaceae archaeon]
MIQVGTFGTSDKRRSFIAIDVPAQIKDKLAAACAEIPVANRPVPKGNMHITLFFLGYISDATIGKVESAMEGLDYGSFGISVNGLGTFPKGRPDVVFAKIDSGSEDIARIHGILRDGIGALGIKLDRRRFTPHITIARIYGLKGKDAVKSFIGANSGTEFGSFTCMSIKLKLSELGSGGAAHYDLYAKGL